MITPYRSDIERHLTTARWFAGKGRPFRVAGVRSSPVPGGDAGLELLVVLVEVEYLDEADGTELYQLPVTVHAAPKEHLEHAWIGRWDGRHAYDATHDRDAMTQWLRAFTLTADDLAGVDTPLRFHRCGGAELPTDERPGLMTGEQSNSSVAYGEELLMKLFRKVTPGPNPDIEIHEVLTRAGSDHVAALHGWADWETEEGEIVQLAMLQQFLRTGSDGWALARSSARALFAEADLHAHEVGGDFASEAARLGQALAETHETLAEHFPTEPLGADGARALADTMLARLDWAIDQVPALRPYAERLRPRLAAVADVAGAAGVRAQRIHGDLHLGQTLRTVKGWKLVDFEGEPARPLHERSQPEPVWRDVAGMLRSFDYAAAVVQRELGGEGASSDEQRAYRAEEWVERNRQAFLNAYVGGELTAEQELLCDAFEADKAVYECVYELRNRPDWADIPLAAVARLVASDAAAVAE
jgi:maltokinase